MFNKRMISSGKTGTDILTGIFNTNDEKMAGIAGFEPAHDEIKTRCLTAWRYPSNVQRTDQNGGYD